MVCFALVANLAFIPRWGSEGAALASMLTLVLFNMIRIAFIQYHYQIQALCEETGLGACYHGICHGAVGTNCTLCTRADRTAAAISNCCLPAAPSCPCFAYITGTEPVVRRNDKACTSPFQTGTQ